MIPGDTLTPAQRQSLGELAKNANEQLLKAGAEGAEQSFGLGCALSILPVAIVVVVMNFLSDINIIGSMIVLLLGGMISLGVTALIAYQARARRISQVYERTTQPEISGQLASDGLSDEQFNQMVHEVLPEDAPLRAFRPLPSVEISQE